jgi:hypothetical protein
MTRIQLEYSSGQYTPALVWMMATTRLRGVTEFSNCATQMLFKQTSKQPVQLLHDLQQVLTIVTP